MRNFTYFRPQSVEQAVALLENRFGNTELLAGGTDLLSLQKEYVAQPARVISLNAIPNFGAIETDNQNPPRWIKIGAGASLAGVAAHAGLRQHFAGLTAAAGEIAGPQIRNMGTLGGSLCQRNRCWYFRDEHVNCLLKGGQRCFALDGENRYHAIFTQNNPCVIASPSTLGPVLIALGATAEAVGPRGVRTIEMANFFQAPRQANDREHTLASNEVLRSVTIPLRDLASAHYEVRQKQSSDWPLVQAVVAFRLNNGKTADVKIVLGHVGPRPIVAEAAQRALENRAVTDETATAAGRAAIEGARPLSQNAYKLRLVEVAVKRAAMMAAGLNRYWE